MNDREFLAKMPKAELHLHLEGTVSPETLWEMASRNHVALPVGSLKELRGLYEFESFDKFIELWLAMCRCFRSDADYENMVDAFAADGARHNIRYVEAHFTPYNHEKYGIGGSRALEVVTRRIEAVQASGGPVIRLILDIPSEAGDVSAEYTAALLERTSNPYVAAIGLGGPEAGFPRNAFARHFERARRAGYACVAHAGETAGAHHVRQAVEELGARRVQHGVRSAEDPAVLSLLASRGICCDVALTSNLCLKVAASLAVHPLRKLLAAGVPVTLSTDDPPFFNTDLTREYVRANEEMGFTREELWELNLNGLRHGLAEAGIRRKLMREFESRR
ncbi:MAG: adenosine deaminase [Elusimicrobiota bacterium]